MNRPGPITRGLCLPPSLSLGLPPQHLDPFGALYHSVAKPGAYSDVYRSRIGTNPGGSLTNNGLVTSNRSVMVTFLESSTVATPRQAGSQGSNFGARAPCTRMSLISSLHSCYAEQENLQMRSKPNYCQPGAEHASAAGALHDVTVLRT